MIVDGNTVDGQIILKDPSILVAITSFQPKRANLNESINIHHFERDNKLQQPNIKATHT